MRTQQDRHQGEEIRHPFVTPGIALEILAD